MALIIWIFIISLIKSTCIKLGVCKKRDDKAVFRIFLKKLGSFFIISIMKILNDQFNRNLMDEIFIIILWKVLFFSLILVNCLRKILRNLFSEKMKNPIGKLSFVISVYEKDIWNKNVLHILNNLKNIKLLWEYAPGI